MTPEQEFRKLFNERMDKIEVKIDKVSDEMSTLKIKVAGVASFIGSIITVFVNLVIKN
jgi:tetrahydromethanopterin S-methyltransferase subunit G